MFGVKQCDCVIYSGVRVLPTQRQDRELLDKAMDIP